MDLIDKKIKEAISAEIVEPYSYELAIKQAFNKKKNNNLIFFIKRMIITIISIIGVCCGTIGVYAVSGGKIAGKPVFEWIGVKFTDDYDDYRVEEKQQIAYGETKVDLVSSMCDDGITILEFDVKLSEKDREYLRLDQSIITEEGLEEAKKTDERMEKIYKNYKGIEYNRLYQARDILNTVKLTFFNIKDVDDSGKETYWEDGSCDLLIDGKKVYTTTNQTVTKISDYEYKIYQMYFLPEEKTKNKKEFSIRLNNVMLENIGDIRNKEEEDFHIINTGHNERKIKIEGSFEIKVSKEKALQNTKVLKPKDNVIKYKNMVKKIEEVKITPMQIIVKVSTKRNKVSLNTLTNTSAKDHINIIEVSAYDNNNQKLSIFDTETKRTITYSNGKTEEWYRGDIGTYKSFYNATMNLTEYYIIEKKEDINSIRINLQERQEERGKETKDIGDFEFSLQ